ncbi:hypothetical protein [Longimicrobium sp.]|uniref:hypothetical protein n=1 Tax=Longimicrobium sp. TaxID=2029185 RepID=UPI002E3137CF|nr:hypothetical protein [Longimicrobium sp.]HEX6039890.1 hypothetical protein [Longimicrobium sp.]
MRKSVLTLAAAALALSACAGDGTGPGSAGEGLSQPELVQLNRAILGISAGVRGHARGASLSTRTGESLGTGSLTFDFNDTAPCQPAGSVGVAGTIGISWNDAAQTGGLSADFAVAHDGCAMRLDNGQLVTLTGDPDIDVMMDAATGPGGLTALRITEQGAFTWARDAGNHGRCTVDVVAELNPTTGQVVLSGSFCGMNVTGTYQG